MHPWEESNEDLDKDVFKALAIYYSSSTCLYQSSIRLFFYHKQVYRNDLTLQDKYNIIV